MQDLEFLDRQLLHSQLTSSVFFAGEPCGGWQVDNSGSGAAGFHLVVQGRPWLHRPGTAVSPLQLETEDFVFFRHEATHVLSDSPETPAQFCTRVDAMTPLGTASDRTGLICGRVMLEQGVRRFLLAPLPDVVVMGKRSAHVSPVVGAVVRAMWHEARSQAQPLTAALNKLADVLVAHVIRFAVASGLTSSGLFAGLADPNLRRALIGLIEAPEQPWTVESLAGKALMSRSAFAARFQAVVGQAPLEFVREWRMQNALALLRSGRSVAEAAASCGYDSEASFAKAFKRVMGTGPGAARPK